MEVGGEVLFVSARNVLHHHLVFTNLPGIQKRNYSSTYFLHARDMLGALNNHHLKDYGMLGIPVVILYYQELPGECHYKPSAHH